MTTFVVLAAGRGTRVGRVGGNLHKALLPLGGKAILSHLLELVPRDARLVVCVGDRADQLRDYVELAHPQRDVTFVNVSHWMGPGSGPGTSLIAARDVVGDDMLFTSCDTLWTATTFDTSTSWAAYAPMPAGTDVSRWCRLDVNDGDVTNILDKTPYGAHVSNVYTGLAHVAREDLETFWAGVLTGRQVDDELQVTGGLRALVVGNKLRAQRIDWIDTGDEAAYRRAVAQVSGYDWTKTDQATYVLPETERVVKYMASRVSIETRWQRGTQLADAVPSGLDRRVNMIAYGYVKGETVYERLDRTGDTNVTRDLLSWRDKRLMRRVPVTSVDVRSAVNAFYRGKTLRRVGRLRQPLRDTALDAVERVDFYVLGNGFEPGVPHGDLNFGNVVITDDDHFVGIDWREDFAGQPWFDLRYDVAKLLAGTVVHWGRARRGDFTPWDDGVKHARVIRDYLTDGVNTAHDVEIIGALSLLNSAPLHASPLDEILVARGCAWLESLT